jgi:sugar phosphate permease
LRSAVTALLHNRSFILLTLAYTVQSFAYNPIEFWLPTILQRDKGISLAQASANYGTIVLIAGMIGPILGGLIGDSLAKRYRLAYYWICAATAFAAVLPLFVIATQQRGGSLFSAVFAEILLGNVSTGLVFAILVTVVIPGLRGTATAVMLTSMHLLGDLISQPLIGKISSLLSSGLHIKFLESLRVAMQIPTENHLSLALLIVTVPASLMASLLYLLGMPQPQFPKRKSAGQVK